MRFKIGLFGGTFDPIHNGHLAIAQSALDEISLDQIIFLPAGVPPHKLKAPLTSKHVRKRMLEEAIRPYIAFSISDYDLNKTSYCYTIEMLQHFHQSEIAKNSDFFLLIGQDSLAHFHEWYKAEQIAEYAKIVVYPRKGIKTKHSISIKPDKLIFLNAKINDISSTKIRKLAEAGENIKNLVPVPVAEMVSELGLYKHN
ncbi:MAG: nicotinate (nicotinamide) nucleotide adenylyltransferase [Deferribacteres bacterium]|nr:nicotinate-nucleotide adenylyltransferase [candidate division KSB1 bacterium]MCB9501477.1 nicotinate (nicotinamide) nucleotide adenylyltransferase [Deferribacteres bacterium]